MISAYRLAWIFDVDGTLLLTEGAAREAFAHAVQDRFQVGDDLRDIAFAGRTEPLILADILEKHHIQLDAEGEARFWDNVFEHMRARLKPGRGRLLDGVTALLDELALEPDWVVGLLTGNMTEMAHIKLTHFGLWDRFSFGAFGEQAADRDGLAKNLASHLGRQYGLAPGRCIVIGDTEHDVGCARAAGMKVIAVATGFRSHEELASHAPDLLLASLADTRRVMEWGRTLDAASPGR